MGFPMRCDPLSIEPLNCGICLVSIPYGFSNALRLFAACLSIPIGRSFNPLWVFQGAATEIDQRQFEISQLFQSLMGFPMRRDAVDPGTTAVVVHSGFNPLWVFQCAATESCTAHLPFRRLSFNPLWVFQCAATSRS